MLCCISQFVYVKPSLNSWNEANFMMHDFFSCVVELIQFGKYFIEDVFVLCSSWKWAYSFCFFCLSGFGSRIILTSQNEFGSVASLCIFWNHLRSIGVLI
jgi:hypothetical protein